MLEPASVLGTDTLDVAFRTMHGRRLSGLYVVDAGGRVSGYLDLLELALRYAEAIAVDDATGDG
jgi:CBS domain-containing protein